MQQSCGQALPAVGSGHRHVAAIKAPRLGCGKRSRQQLHTAKTLLALTLEMTRCSFMFESSMVTVSSMYTAILCMLCVCTQMLHVMSLDNLNQPTANIRTVLRGSGGLDDKFLCKMEHVTQIAVRQHDCARSKPSHKLLTGCTMRIAACYHSCLALHVGTVMQRYALTTLTKMLADRGK